MNNFVNWCNRVIEFSFYALFFITPLTFFKDTSELFEFNKMWVVFTLTVIIATLWFTKMVLESQIKIQRTPLDIPILLFLFSQVISTLYSIDTHVSLWGYYSRFNGGLFSIIAYIFLYYAFVSNFSFTKQESPTQPHSKKNNHLLLTNLQNTTTQTIPSGFVMTKRLLIISLLTGACVALWGLPSHFGYDPTCALFRGTFDVSCWTAAFQPKIRIFSTFGQPNWLAAYLAILLPIAIAYFLNTLYKSTSEKTVQKKNILLSLIFILLVVLFYVDLLYTKSQSGFAAIAVCLFLFFLFTFYNFFKTQKIPLGSLLKQKTTHAALYVITILLLATVLIGQPIERLNFLSLHTIQKFFAPNTQQQKPVQPIPAMGEIGGTDSGKIRQIVWKGAIDAWKHYPFFGSGVETFAFAYYMHRPVEHNLTSEWDFLYNKAHNEYLNFLTTTGIFGLGTYLLMIITFLFISLKRISNFKFQISNHTKEKNTIEYWTFDIGNWKLVLALICGYITILITNFFGFSVVVVNLYLFLIPAFVLILTNSINPANLLLFPKKMAPKKEPVSLPSKKPQKIEKKQLFLTHWVYIMVILCLGFYSLLTLYNYWIADIIYAESSGLTKVGRYQDAYKNLHRAIELRPDEPTFQNELTVVNAGQAISLLYQKDTSEATKYIVEAIETSNRLVSEHPYNVTYWKARARILSVIGQIDEQYLQFALDAIEKAQVLAPTDAGVSYNLGLLYGKTGNTQKAVTTLENTIQLKKDHKEAYYALGLYYRTLAVNKDGVVIKPEYAKKANDTMNYILKYLSPSDKEVLDTLEQWNNPPKI